MMRNGQRQNYFQMICIINLSIKASYVHLEVEISLQTKPVIIGEAVQISCIDSNSSTKSLEGLTWYRKDGSSRIPIVHNGKSNEKSKYLETDGNNHSERILNIFQFSGKDVYKNYSCEIGLNEGWLYLDLNEKDYVYFPLQKEIFVTMSINRECLNIHGFLYKVFPLPKHCEVDIHGATFFSDALANVTTKGIFYAAEFQFREMSLESIKAEHMFLEVTCVTEERFVKIYKAHVLINQQQRIEKTKLHPGLIFFLGSLTGGGLTVVVYCIKDRQKSNRQDNDTEQETEDMVLRNTET